MSIALNARIKELEAGLSELRQQFHADHIRRLDEQVEALRQQVATLENRPKPGRPPKNG